MRCSGIGARAFALRRQRSHVRIVSGAPIAFKTADISVLSRGSALDRSNKDVDKRSDEILHVAPVSRGLAQTSHAEDERTRGLLRRHLQTRSAEALGDELDDEALEISIDLLNDGIPQIEQVRGVRVCGRKINAVTSP